MIAKIEQISLVTTMHMCTMVEFLQRPLHPLSHVEVNTADCCPTVDQSSGLSDFSFFHLVKSHRNSDCLSRCGYKYGPNVCGE